MILSAIDINKNFGTKQLLKDANLFIEENQKIGIIGVNGTGKTTLLKIIGGVIESDSGEISMMQNLKISYLAQNPFLCDDYTCLKQIESDFKAALADYNEYEAKAMLNRFGVFDYNKLIGTMSGGERKRVAMTSALLKPCDLLILDEPTNHLDSFMVSYLEERLKKFKGAVLMVTHDRYFLERVCTEIGLLEKGKIERYKANYSEFLALHEQQKDMEQASERKRQSVLRRESEWLMRGARARGTKSRERIERYWDLAEKDAPEDVKTVEISTESQRLGKKIIEIKNVSKAFDGKVIIGDFSYNLMRDDRIGIVGKNGAGKSTLLNIITGKLPPDTGTVSVGDTVKIGYFTQSYGDFPEEVRVYDYIHDINNEIATVNGILSASKILELFLFTPDLQYSKIKELSGGEKRRLKLLALLAESPNILILDEPTNDLDIETLLILEEYIEGFKGAVISVSHDRYFLDKTVAKIFEVSDGNVTAFNGNYSDYEEKREYENSEKEKKLKITAVKQPPREKRLKMTFKEEREFETIDDDIEKLNTRILKKEEEIAGASRDYLRLKSLTEEMDILKASLSEMEERWLYLTELKEKLISQEIY